jgi:bacterioferritin-associated ferredoxin
MLNSRSTSVLVSRCICKATSFGELLALATASGWDLAQLVRETGCGGECGLCRPYLSRMLRTGETEFHEILTAEDS